MRVAQCLCSTVASLGYVAILGRFQSQNLKRRDLVGEGNLQMSLKDIRYEGLGWIYLAQDSYK